MYHMLKGISPTPIVRAWTLHAYLRPRSVLGKGTLLRACAIAITFGCDRVLLI